MNHDDIRAALSDHQAFVCTLSGEVAGEPVEGQIAVANVIRNRALNPRWWGNDYKGVCLQPAQFSCWWETNANTDRVYTVAELLLQHADLGERTTLSQLSWIARGTMANEVRDLTRGADHYLTKSLFHSSRCPAWAKGRTPVALVGAHAFFRLELLP